MIASFRRSFLAALLFTTAVAACDLAPPSSSDPARDRWGELEPQTRTRVADLRSRQTVVAGRVGALMLPPGVDDPPLAAQFTDMQGKVSAVDPAIAAVEQEAAAVTGEVEAALAAHDKIRARKAVEGAAARLDALYNRADATLTQIEPRLPALENALQQHLMQAQSEQQRFDHAATAGGELELPGLSFGLDDAQLDIASPASKATLDRLVKLGGMCQEMRVVIGGQITRADAAGAATLAKARAETVRTYLINAGVPADRVALAGGLTPPSPAKDRMVATVITPCQAPMTPPEPAIAPPAPVPMPAAPTAERVQTPPPSAQRAPSPAPPAGGWH